MYKEMYRKNTNQYLYRGSDSAMNILKNYSILFDLPINKILDNIILDYHKKCVSSLLDNKSITASLKSILNPHK